MGLSPIFTPQQKNVTGSSPGCDRPSQGSAHKLLVFLGTTEKGRILQTIYAPLPVVDVHSNFASGKTARFASSPIRKDDSVQTPFSLEVADNVQCSSDRPVRRPRRCRTATEWNAKRGNGRSDRHRADGEAHRNMTRCARVPHYTPTASRPGCTVNRFRDYLKQASLGSTKWCRSSL